MAEIIAVAASGAGLASLAIQLMESSQKLHSFYHTCKDAPDTLNQLSFELATLSKHILQLQRLKDQQSQAVDAECEELLDRCLHDCARMSAKINTAVKKIEQSLQKSRFVGRVYTAFKEPEIRKVLAEMEQAKTYMILAHLQYIEFWQMRQMVKISAFMVQQSAINAGQWDRIDNFDRAMRATGLGVPVHRTTFNASSSSSPTTLPDDPDDPSTSHQAVNLSIGQTRSKGRFSPILRISLPPWFTDRVWEIGTYDVGLDNVYSLQLRSFKFRPHNSAVFKAVRSGDVEVVQKLLASNDLSIMDHAHRMDLAFPDLNLLMIAAEFGHTELCEFLYQANAYSREDAVLQSALLYYIRSSSFWNHNKVDPCLTDALYHFFMKHGLMVDLEDPNSIQNSICENESIANTSLLTESSLQEVFNSQIVPFKQWPFARRFPTSLHSQGWPANVFLDAIKSSETNRMVRSTDSEGRTALHWAAEQLGRCFGFKRGRELKDPDITDRVQEYEGLVSELIRLGADAHAIDANHRSPFLACLDAMSNKLLSAPMIPTLPDTSTLEATVREWGKAITDGGLPLLCYTAHENRDIRLLHPTQRTFGGDGSQHHYILERLQIRQNADLIAHVTVFETIDVWQFSPPPGAWEESHYKRTISLHLKPRIEREDFHLWKIIGSHRIRSGSFPMTGDSHLPWCQSLDDAWEDFMRTAQDDHGPIAMIESRALALDNPSRVAPKRRRAHSYTRTVTPLDTASPFPDKAPPRVRLYHGGRWLLNAHKCFLTSRWSVWRGWDPGDSPREADCLSGNCINLGPMRKHHRYWEVEYIQSQCDINRVRWFIDRYCPRGRQILNERLEENQRQVELDKLLGKRSTDYSG